MTTWPLATTERFSTAGIATRSPRRFQLLPRSSFLDAYSHLSVGLLGTFRVPSPCLPIALCTRRRLAERVRVVWRLSVCVERASSTSCLLPSLWGARKLSTRKLHETSFDTRHFQDRRGQSNMLVSGWKKSPGACRPCAWRARRACRWAVGPPEPSHYRL